ncbi:MAG: hypothetical protein ACI8ZM_002623 [Crocinitomix sp.]|jgi:hypothetical protein
MSSMIFFETTIRIFRYFSILCLAIGILTYLMKWRKANHEIGLFIITLFLFECFSIKIGALLGNNLILFLISTFFHFYFLTLIYFKLFFNVNALWKYTILGLGSIPILIQSFNYFVIDVETFHSYDRAIYDLFIVLYAFLAYYKIALQKTWSKGLLFLNGSTLLYFAFDIFLAITTNFLINYDLAVVSWFWIARSICLQCF